MIGVVVGLGAALACVPLLVGIGLVWWAVLPEVEP